jgi:hypothetical protein
MSLPATDSSYKEVAAALTPTDVSQFFKVSQQWELDNRVDHVQGPISHEADWPVVTGQRTRAIFSSSEKEPSRYVGTSGDLISWRFGLFRRRRRGGRAPGGIVP